MPSELAEIQILSIWEAALYRIEKQVRREMKSARRNSDSLS